MYAGGSVSWEGHGLYGRVSGMYGAVVPHLGLPTYLPTYLHTYLQREDTVGARGVRVDAVGLGTTTTGQGLVHHGDDLRGFEDLRLRDVHTYIHEMQEVRRHDAPWPIYLPTYLPTEVSPGTGFSIPFSFTAV